jgi:hypothetical protein
MKKSSIKVIKRKQRELLNGEAAAALIPSKTENQSQREMVSAVSSWIKEKRVRKVPSLKKLMLVS